MNKLYLFLFICILAITSCSSGNKKETSDSVQEQLPQPETTVSETDKGKTLFLKYCMACHQTDGSGVPGMYPPLIKSPIINGDKNKAIGILLNGLSGPIEINGKSYNQVMPKVDYLSDEEIAQILTFVGKSFQNNGAEVKPEEVRALRNTKP